MHTNLKRILYLQLIFELKLHNYCVISIFEIIIAVIIHAYSTINRLHRYSKSQHHRNKKREKRKKKTMVMFISQGILHNIVCMSILSPI